MATETDGGAESGSVFGLTVLTVFLSGLLLVSFFLYAWAQGSNWVQWSRPTTTVVLQGVGWTAASVVVIAVGVAAIRAAWNVWKVDGPGIFAAVLLGLMALVSLIVPAYIAAFVVWTHAPNAFSQGRTNYPLHDAACRGDTESVKKHLRTGLSASYQYRDGGMEGDALARHFQCMNSDAAFNFELVGTLISAGSKVDGHDRAYSPPLHRVIEKIRPSDRAAALTYLVQRGAYIETHSGNEVTPLVFAAMKGDAESVRTLLALGARVDSTQLARIYREMRFCGTAEEGAFVVPEKMKPYVDIVDALFQAGATVTWDDLYRAGLSCGREEHLIGQYIRTQYPSRVLHPAVR